MKRMFVLVIFSCTLFSIKINCEENRSGVENELYSKTASYISYMEFLKLNTAYTTIEDPLLIKQEIIKYSDKKTQKSKDYVYCLFHKNGQCVQIKNAKNKVQYFFASPQGYWLYTNKLKTPLKISGSYKVEEHEVQDILKTDFQNEYKILESCDAYLVLQKISGNSAYKFIIFEDVTLTYENPTNAKESTYSLTFCDNKKNKVRRLVYHKGSVDSFSVFKQIDIYNLLFKKDTYMSWQTLSIQKASLPSSLFAFSKIKQLTEQMARLLE